MTSNLRVRVGLYGAAFHAVVAAVVAAIGAKNRAAIPPSFYAVAVPALLASAFLVYALAVAPYVRRRVAKRGTVFFDAAVGMAVEPLVIGLTAAAFGAIAALSAPGGGVNVGGSAVVTVLWAFGNFMTQILALGNAAGLIGWWLSKRFGGAPASA